MKNERLKSLLELNYKENEKVLISPIGQAIGIDGRVFNIPADKVILNTRKNGLDLVLDVDHSLGEFGSQAAGWIKFESLEIKEDGIYGSLGSELISKNIYRYISPAYIMDKNSSTKEVLAIDSIGLVNRPNLIKTALNEKEQQEDLETLKEEARNSLKELSLNYEAKEDALKELNRKNSFL